MAFSVLFAFCVSFLFFPLFVGTLNVEYKRATGLRKENNYPNEKSEGDKMKRIKGQTNNKKKSKTMKERKTHMRRAHTDNPFGWSALQRHNRCIRQLSHSTQEIEGEQLPTMERVYGGVCDAVTWSCPWW